MLLFSLPPEPASTNEELAQLTKKYPEYNAVYLNVHMRDDWKRVKDFFELEWREFKKLADINFSKEIKKQFSQRAWELYLFHLFRKNNFKFNIPKKNCSYPDFEIKLNNNKRLFVEAVVAGKGENTNRVETLSDLLSSVPPGTFVSRGGHIDNSNLPKVRRILSSLTEKISQFGKHKKIVGENDYYIIAVNAGDIEGNIMGDELILEVVANINPVVHIPRNKDGTFGPSFKTIRKSIPNSTQTNQIDTGIFNNKENEEISAVIYFGRDIPNAVLQDKSDDVLIVHNPNALPNKKINMKLFSKFRQIIFTSEGYSYLNPLK